MIPFFTIVTVVGAALLAGLYIAGRRRFALRQAICPATGTEVDLAVESLHSGPFTDKILGHDVVRCSRFSPCTDVNCDKACAAQL